MSSHTPLIAPQPTRVKLYGMSQTRDYKYACAAALSYWVFRCRDRKRSPAMGTKTWTYLESSIENASQAANNIEKFLANLQNALVSSLRPAELLFVIGAHVESQTILRLQNSTNELMELPSDQANPTLTSWGWRDLVDDACKNAKCREWHILDVCRQQSSIVQLCCRTRFEEDKLLGVPDDVIEVEAEEINNKYKELKSGI